MAETSTKLGRVSLVPRGEYDAAATYNRLDIVEYEGSSYLVLADGTAGVTPAAGTFYMLVAEKGDTGAAGPIGATGPQGIQGEKGDAGDAGPTGPKGDTGERGQKGDVGETGPAGPKGDTGETGNGIAGIERTSGTGAAGTTDTYTITMTDGSTSTFQVYNGADGTGAGDMLKSVYDPQNKNTDIFSYVDNAVSGVEIDVDVDPTEGSPNPVSSGGTFSALAAKQDKLTGQPGQAVGFSADGIAVAVPGWSSPNLLDNWYFADPINQRGKTEYTGSGAYTIDRWLITANSVTAALAEDGLKLDFDGTISWDGIEQPVEGAAQYRGQTVTLSALVKGQEGKVFGLRCRVQKTGAKYTARFVGTGDWMLVANTFTVDEDASVLSPIIASYETAEVKTLTVRAIKLELGTRQTLARQDADGGWVLNDPPPDKALELAKCQRYFVNLAYPLFTAWQPVGFALGRSAASADAELDFPVDMRAKPAASMSEEISLIDETSSSGNKIAVTSAAIVGTGVRHITLRLNTAGGLTAGKMYHVWMSGAAGSLQFSADL